MAVVSDIDRQKLIDSLAYFGIGQVSGVEELRRLLKEYYYRFARFAHPDRNGTTEKFQELQGHYQYLEELLAARPGDVLELISGRSFKKSGKEGWSGGDKAYGLYKKGVELYNRALGEYFSKTRVVNLDPGEQGYQQLVESLLEARSIFSEVIKAEPCGIWVPDSREKIERIDNWLPREG